jgi:hypothetical protein
MLGPIYPLHDDVSLLYHLNFKNSFAKNDYCRLSERNFQRIWCSILIIRVDESPKMPMLCLELWLSFNL